MKLPKTFVPEKDLKKKVSQLLSKEYCFSKNYLVFNDIGIEPQINKTLLTFDKSLERLKKEGYERHLRPWEYFNLVTGRLEGKLPENLDNLAKEMLNGEGEWLSLTMKRRGNKLSCYVDPKNLVWDEKKKEYFTCGNLEYNYKEEFDIRGVPPRQWICLKQFPDEFIKFMYGRRFEDLPKEMQEGDKKAQIYPPYFNDILYPVGFYKHSSKFSLVGIGVRIYNYGYVDHEKASRGVLKKPGNEGKQ